MEDPLPIPASYIDTIALFNRRQMRFFVALVLCLFLGLTLFFYQNCILIEGKHGSWLIKLNSSVTQAPRGVFLGALAVLPQKVYSESVLFSQLRENNIKTYKPFLLLREWLVMVWYGSSYL